jgi:hemerythrin-like domain-containing protein
MEATDILVAEHEIILEVIGALETQTGRLQAGNPVRTEFFLDAVDFIRNFADGCHHRKEEGVLFPAMAAGGLGAESGPIAVMLAEHVQGRAYTRAMEDAAKRLFAGESAAAVAVAENALGYGALLRRHIAKENTILFPMAERFIPEAKRAAVNAAFDRIETEETGAGVHEKYHALAEKLVREAASG